ncbi:hypothetical protein OC844_003599 [Tilletia horrida]|nr:hypothetical protein OC844_003599 [Tilletia horrida]
MSRRSGGGSGTRSALLPASSTSTSTSSPSRLLEIRIPNAGEAVATSRSNGKGKERALDPPLLNHDLADVRTAGRIYAWADNAHNAAKCFACHVVHGATQLRAEGFPGAVFLLEQRPFVYADVVGIVVGVTEKETRSVYLIDDGTAVLQVIEILPKSARRTLRQVGDAVRAIGKVRTEWDERVLHVEHLELLLDMHDEIKHIHAVCKALRTAYCNPFELNSAPTAHTSSTLTQPTFKPRETTIPAAYLPPVYTNVNYYSHAHRSNPLGLELDLGQTLRSPDSTPPAKTTTRMPQIPSSGAYSLFSSPFSQSQTESQSQRRHLRAWYKLKGSELSASRFRPYVAQHIHLFCSAPSNPNELRAGSQPPPPFTVRYLRRQDDLRKHAERVVLHELEKRGAKKDSATKMQKSSSSTSLRSTRGRYGDDDDLDIYIRKEAATLTSEAMAAKVKRLFESIIRQLLDDGVIEIAPEAAPVRWPFNGRKARFRPSHHEQQREQQPLSSRTAFYNRAATAAASATSKGGSKKWGGTAAEMFLCADDVEVPFLGSSDTESDGAGDGDAWSGLGRSKRLSASQSRSAGTAGKSSSSRARSRRRDEDVFQMPSSSGASAVLDADGRTLTPQRRRPVRNETRPAKKTKKLGTNPFDDAISIHSSPSSPPRSASQTPRPATQAQAAKKGTKNPDESSSAGITSDTEGSESDWEEGWGGGSAADGSRQRAAGSPTPRATRTLPYSSSTHRGTSNTTASSTLTSAVTTVTYANTQQAAMAWRTGWSAAGTSTSTSTSTSRGKKSGGVVHGHGHGLGLGPRQRARQEAYRLVVQSSTSS